MKNRSQQCEITYEDFDSLNMRESILETNQTGNAGCILSESRFNCRIFYNFSSFNLLNRYICGKLLKNKQAASKSRAERLKNNRKINGEIKNYVSISINFRKFRTCAGDALDTGRQLSRQLFNRIEQRS
jgi:hypothetical protein